ncbi:1-aminocyclopropane-1-carboxylate deaminase/D-cysteine desulfhydrase [Methylomicrobium lacus]|uniref:1-aminocyclopropane-1-carboxylate deaminase/D-cysteine desulfhydrase n=1 Tax=Methylomicrobium lacus TaxID=136992 RepID=UPI0035A9201B
MPSTLHAKLSALERGFKTSALEKIADPLLQKRQIDLWLKRDDLLHPVISGNKWRKLKFILNHALELGSDTLISMGGFYSNHLHALAYAGKELGLKTIGLVRGEPPQVLSPTLEDCRNWGMELRFVSRSDYRRLRQYRESFDLPGISPGQYWLPEGGAQALALQGVAELVEEIGIPFDVLCLPCGTGTTLAGCIAALDGAKTAIGFAALKNADFLASDVERLLTKSSLTPALSRRERGKFRCQWQINQNYHCGGFAKTTPELLEFIRIFELTQQIPLEPVYTGKMLYGLFDMIAKGEFAPGQRIIAVHTGGLQGRRGFNAI